MNETHTEASARLVIRRKLAAYLGNAPMPDLAEHMAREPA
jgi:hypothetical protein